MSVGLTRKIAESPVTDFPQPGKASPIRYDILYYSDERLCWHTEITKDYFERLRVEGVPIVNKEK